jgi:hypothetical protein
VDCPRCGIHDLRTEVGPAAYGWDRDQRWTLARVAALVMRLFGVCYSLRGVSFLLHRLGFTPQVPAGTTGQLAAAMRHQLDRIQKWPALITGFLGQTRLTLEPQPP